MALGLISMTSADIFHWQSFAFAVPPNMAPGIVSEQSTCTSLSPQDTVAISFSWRAVHDAAPLMPSWPRAKFSTESGQLLQHGNDFHSLSVVFSRRLSMNPHLEQVVSCPHRWAQPVSHFGALGFLAGFFCCGSASAGARESLGAAPVPDCCTT